MSNNTDTNKTFIFDPDYEEYESRNYDEDGTMIPHVVYFVEASNSYGEVYRFHLADGVERTHREAISRVTTLAFIFQHQADRGELDPTDCRDWHFNRYAYGSEAYAGNYAEAEVARMTPDEVDFHKRNHTLPV